MKPKQLSEMGVPQDCMTDAIDAVRLAFRERHYGSKSAITATLKEVIANPGVHTSEAVFGKLAQSLLDSDVKFKLEQADHCKNPYGVPGKWRQWGEADENCQKQMQTAVNLPVAVQAALMPDGHLGFGVPIGSVLGLNNAVSPNGVGVDIACRMKLSPLDIPVERLADVFSPKVDTFIRALTGGTVFGVDRQQTAKADHPVMDMDWNMTPVTKQMKDRAWSQLGTSGGGNHFVEFGILTLDKPDLGLAAGKYVALMSHSGSRGTGKAVCDTYRDIALSRLSANLEEFKDLAWLSLDSEAGQEYWKAMNLMGEYAHGNHEVIHQRVAALLGAEILTTVENHHNFAWREQHGDRELIVHRKGATPAGKGVLGVIPGSMASPAFIVRGKGHPDSLLSASHGAGRLMSRTQAKKNFNWSEWKSILKQRGVRVLSCGLDEVPGAYKDINMVMAQQADLVEKVAQFDPKIVRMADDGKSED